MHKANVNSLIISISNPKKGVEQTHWYASAAVETRTFRCVRDGWFGGMWRSSRQDCRRELRGELCREPRLHRPPSVFASLGRTIHITNTVESQTRTLPNKNTAVRIFTNGQWDEPPHQAPSGEHVAYLAAIPMESAIAIEQSSNSRNAELIRKRMRDNVQRPKAEQWVTATDCFGVSSSFRGVPETSRFASTANVPPPYDFQGYSRFPDYYTCVVDGINVAQHCALGRSLRATAFRC